MYNYTKKTVLLEISKILSKYRSENNFGGLK